MDTILALDTATENCSAALKSGDKVFHTAKVAPREHADLILKMVDDLLKLSEVKKTAVKIIAFDKGPGSFTGVRIAASAAQGLALGLDAKVVGVSSLEAMAHEALKNQDHGKCVSAIDARMGEVYLGLFYKENGLLYEEGQSLVLPPQDAVLKVKNFADNEGIKFAGTGIAVLKLHGFSKNVREAALFPDALSIIEIAEVKIAEGKAAAPELAVPTYLRNEVAWKKISMQGRKF